MENLIANFLKIFVICLIFCNLTAIAQKNSVGTMISGTDFGTTSEKESLIELHEENWHTMLKGEWMVEFFAPWCPACRNLAPTWERFAKIAFNININVATIDVTTSPSLSGRFFVTALPTIYHVIDGEFRQYRGSREADALILFLKQKQWQKIDPISAWKKPDTIHMSLLSYFFKLSHILKDFNSRLQEEYGLPTWGSYALFAIGTIFIGAVLGLMLVCIVDLLYPPKKSQRQNFSECKEKSYNTVEDIVNDEIEDETVPQQYENGQNPEENDSYDENDNNNEAIHEDSDNDSISDYVNSKTESDERESDKCAQRRIKP